ncbi:isopenicillin N synthase-like dioxygenase [Tamaricihabitans halophyticus]|uniref:Isopenicillin N synthase-like dioxygenase n=1 Tax=Tamaricihabitans halophyticus TaxID=1262583 RepID=A0A4R2QQP2_9PSEU|nr:2OG-Fe(II) oxygenase family protein [Tamaricihabitans halophyticus]TCP49361.1 isopenicillin N synthase-like dioxygenase [Tamaricihabitans halophyticus]
MTAVPIINLDQRPATVAAELDAVCREIGFFQITGHGVDAEVADAAWYTARAFFDLPIAERMTVVMPEPGYPFGYSPVAGESLNQSMGGGAPADLKESFNAGPPAAEHEFADPEEASAYLPTPWPDVALPELRQTWQRYYTEMLTLGARLMSLFARGLGLSPDFFADKIDTSPSSLRALNYPEQDAPPAPGQLRAGAHTDYGTLTILRQDDAPGGLQVHTRDGEWAAVPSVPGAFVVNIGDLLARWTNDRWRSTLHRVVNPEVEPGRPTRRQSMPFFHNANWSATVECLPTCLGPGEAPNYPPVLAGPHLMNKFRATVT